MKFDNTDMPKENESHAPLSGVTTRLSDGDSWYKSSLKGIIETQISLVEKGAQKNIDRNLILKWVAKHV